MGEAASTHARSLSVFDATYDSSLPAPWQRGSDSPAELHAWTLRLVPNGTGFLFDPLSESAAVVRPWCNVKGRSPCPMRSFATSDARLTIGSMNG